MFRSDIYDKPFLTTYLCTSTFSLYLVRPLVLDRRRHKKWSFARVFGYGESSSPSRLFFLF
jgi:hypothetical protein